MLINFLIRTSYRPILFKRLIESINNQTHKDVNIIVSYDNDLALSYIPKECRKIKVYKNSEKLFWYDEYINELKKEVNSGYFLIIDDDDFLISNTCIESLCKHLKGTSGLICQFSRSGVLKPSNDLIKRNMIRRGKIGMPCLVLHHSLKDVANFDGSVGAADYHWIKAVSKRVRLKFIALVIAFADRRSNGVLQSED